MGMVAIDFNSFSTACPFERYDHTCAHCDNDCEYCICSSCPLGFSAENEDLSSNNISWDLVGEEKPDEVYEDEYIVIDADDTREEVQIALELLDKYLNRYEQD